MTDRHQFRADWCDYNEGAFYVTICTRNKEHFFGHIRDNEMHLSILGEELERQIKGISSHFPTVELWNHIVMPNHCHILLSIPEAATYNRTNATRGCLKASNHDEETPNYHHNAMLSKIISGIKGGVTRFANIHRLHFAWQARYYDRIINSSYAYRNVMYYIDTNIVNWDKDELSH